MRKIVILVILVALVSSVAIIAFSDIPKDTGPLKIGVLLPLTGPDAIGSESVLDWAAGNINRGGGINKRQVELVYKDTNGQDISALAREFIEDRQVQIVIGPGSSAEVYEIAPTFLANGKVLISPLSTAGDIFRAFGGKQFFWRTCLSDVAQIRTIVYLLSVNDVKRISFIYEDSVYGKTFYDWIGFFSIELGIELLNIVKFEDGQRDFAEVISQALEGDPEYVVCAAFPEEAVGIKKEMDKTRSQARLFLTDAAQAPYLIEGLGEAAEGLEGITPTADPTTGFDIAYQIKFGRTPPAFAATTYDAFLLAAYTLARQECKKGSGEGIGESLEKVVSGRGTNVGWDRQEVNETMTLILHGELPNISGVSGSLEFDSESGVDPLNTFYAHWRVEAGDFRTVETISSGNSSGVGVVKESASAYQTMASQRLAELQETGEAGYVPKEKQDLWAVIIATDMDWTNYRHQADALAIYDLLRNNGVDDDKIILFLIDDIASSPENPMKGNVHYRTGDKNLRENAIIDYSNREVNIVNLRDALLGIRTPDASEVLETNENSNILLYIVDHGSEGLVHFQYGESLKAQEFIGIIENMYQNKRFRQMFVMVDVCHGESMALDLQTPGVVYLTGASEKESSFGTNYDPEIDAWLADDFTYQFLTLVSEDPDLSILNLYTALYQQVAGSHVRLKNYGNFGSIATTSIGEFLSP